MSFATNQPQPIPLTIITGFLGAGKTTLLNRILHADHGLRIAVLVNDFGAVNIDSQLVVGVEEDTVSLSNGCICCTIRDDLLQAVLGLLQRQDPPEYVIIETSGISDPLEVALTFRDVPQLQLDSVLTVIDAEQILTIDRELAVVALNQIGIADIILLNKVDLVDAQHLHAVRKYIKDISPKARILETTEAKIPLELLLNVGAFDLDRINQRTPQAVHVHSADEHDHDHDHHHHDDHTLVFESWSWTTQEPMSSWALQRMIKALPDTIYRAKGIFDFIETPNQKTTLQVVGHRATLTPSDAWGTQPRQSQFVVIGTAGTLDAADLTKRLEACFAVHAPKTELGRLKSGIISWLRGDR